MRIHGSMLATMLLACASAPGADDLGDTTTSAGGGGSTATGSQESPSTTAADESTTEPALDLPAEPADLGDAGPYTLYLDPEGDDSAHGTSPADAIASLSRAEEILLADPPGRDVVLEFAGGMYEVPCVVWHYYDRDHTTTFRGAAEDPPHFVAVAGATGYWLYFDAAVGESTSLHFENLWIDDFVAGGIALVGDPDDPAGWNGDNVISGCRFENLGNADGESQPGYGAVSTWNSRNNLIEGNTFVGLRNSAADARLIHALYLAHHSHDSIIRDNDLDVVSGSPFRVRNDSNGNTFEDNRAREVADAGYSDWYCDLSSNPICERQECPSWNNWLRESTFACGYDDGPLLLFDYIQGEDFVPAGCTNHGAQDGWPRLQTASNELQPDCP